MTYEEYKARVIAAQEQWNQERSVIYLTQNLANFSQIFAGETQPNHLVGTVDSYDHMQLPEILSAVSAMKPAVVHSASEVWSKIGADLSTTIVAFNKAFEATTNGPNGWVGEAATAAVTAVKNYAAQSATLPAAATAVSLKLAEMKTGLEQTQALMPGLTERPTVAGKTLPADGEMKLDQFEGDEALQEARRILRTVYSQVAVQSDTGVPFMPTAPKVVGGDGGAPSIPGGGGSDQGTQSGGTTGDTAGTDGQTTAGTEDGQASENTGTEGTTTTDDGGTADDSTTSSSTDDTTAASTTSPTTTSPTTTTPSGSPTGTNPSTPGTTTPIGTTPGGGRGGSSGSTGGRGGATAPGAGRSVTAAPVGATTAAAAGRAAAGAAGRAGMPGMGGMGAGAGRGGQNDDETHTVPDYLVNQENGEILTGLGDIRTVPPVIGADNDSAQQ